MKFQFSQCSLGNERDDCWENWYFHNIRPGTFSTRLTMNNERNKKIDKPHLIQWKKQKKQARPATCSGRKWRVKARLGVNEASVQNCRWPRKNGISCICRTLVAIRPEKTNNLKGPRIDLPVFLSVSMSKRNSKKFSSWWRWHISLFLWVTIISYQTKSR